MIRCLSSLRRESRGAAAAETALVMPLLFVIMFGSVELGNYFMNEHTLVKAVRDGARFAGRQSFANYTSCGGSPGGTVVADTRNVVTNGVVSGGTAITPNITSTNVTVTTSCMTAVGTQTMAGIYQTRTTGAQIVTVAATVTYRPMLSSAFGFSGVGMTLRAASQAAVTGI